ncbi:uncharacterized protein LOC143857360 [Tasmannia lanceolata]|uniref:uncharacterized protein LOC143857360 n=1 Tax=Tasmannia lanceolata TaxID=3420 RepID=UPI004064403F
MKIEMVKKRSEILKSSKESLLSRKEKEDGHVVDEDCTASPILLPLSDHIALGECIYNAHPSYFEMGIPKQVTSDFWLNNGNSLSNYPNTYLGVGIPEGLVSTGDCFFGFTPLDDEKNFEEYWLNSGNSSSSCSSTILGTETPEGMVSMDDWFFGFTPSGLSHMEIAEGEGRKIMRGDEAVRRDLC